MTDTTPRQEPACTAPKPSLLIRGADDCWYMRIGYQGEEIELRTDFAAAATVLFHVMGDSPSSKTAPIGIEPLWNAYHARRDTFPPNFADWLMTEQRIVICCGPDYVRFALNHVDGIWKLNEWSPGTDFNGTVDYAEAVARLKPLMREAGPFCFPPERDEDEYRHVEVVLKRVARQLPGLPPRPIPPQERKLGVFPVLDGLLEYTMELWGPDGQLGQMRFKSRHVADTAFWAAAHTAVNSTSVETTQELSLPPELFRAPPRAGSLRAVLLAAIGDHTVSLEEAARAVRAAGYATKSAHFVTVVAAALSDRTLFERVARGRYRVRRQLEMGSQEQDTIVIASNAA